MKQLLQSVYSWVDDRLDLDELRHLAGKKTVPDHAHSAWYYWGGVTLFFFIQSNS